jgi:hypothetical protein
MEFKGCFLIVAESILQGDWQLPEFNEEDS